MKPQDIANTAWAFAIVGLQHPRFLDAVGAELERRAVSYVNRGNSRANPPFSSQEITNSIWALATLNYPVPGLLNKLVPVIVGLDEAPLSIASIASRWKRQEMANLAWSCAVFGEYPPELVKMLYMGLSGVGDNPDPRTVAQYFGDGGITQSLVMSMAYLQIAMDLEIKGNPLALPRGYPSDWEYSTSPTPSNQPGKTPMETQGMDGLGDLTLTRSNIQMSVSNAFSRISFDHVDEHVIDMKTLATEHGVQMDPLQTEILSLDIADLSDRIGIEVDGPGHYITNIGDGWASGRGAAYELPNGKLEYRYEWTAEKSIVNGATALKIRLLNRLGWKIISIPFWEWSEVQGESSKEEEYCRNLLQ